MPQAIRLISLWSKQQEEPKFLGVVEIFSDFTLEVSKGDGTLEDARTAFLSEDTVWVIEEI